MFSRLINRLLPKASYVGWFRRSLDSVFTRLILSYGFGKGRFVFFFFSRRQFVERGLQNDPISPRWRKLLKMKDDVDSVNKHKKSFRKWKTQNIRIDTNLSRQNRYKTETWCAWERGRYNISATRQRNKFARYIIHVFAMFHLYDTLKKHVCFFN